MLTAEIHRGSLELLLWSLPPSPPQPPVTGQCPGITTPPPPRFFLFGSNLDSDRGVWATCLPCLKRPGWWARPRGRFGSQSAGHPAAVMRWTPGQVGQSLLSSNAEWFTNQVMHRPPLCAFYVYISSSVDRCGSRCRLLRWNQGREIRVAADSWTAAAAQGTR